MLYLSCIAVIQVQVVTPSKMLNLAYCDVAFLVCLLLLVTEVPAGYYS